MVPPSPRVVFDIGDCVEGGHLYWQVVAVGANLGAPDPCITGGHERLAFLSPITRHKVDKRSLEEYAPLGEFEKNVTRTLAYQVSEFSTC